MKEIDAAIAKAVSRAALEAETAKLARLEGDLSQAKREVEALARKPQSGLSEMVQAVLDGRDMADSGGDDDAPRRRAHQRVQVLERAIEQQRRNVRDARRALANEIGPVLRPHHEKIVGRMAKALRELSEATRDEEMFRFEMDRRELGFGGMRPLGGFANVRLDMTGSEGANWLSEAKEHGYV